VEITKIYTKELRFRINLPVREVSWGMLMSISEIIKMLEAGLGKDKVHSLDFERFVYGTDWSPRTPDEIVPPDVVVTPKTTEDVVKVVKIAYETNTPVTCGGGLTGMAGGAVPIHKGIFLDMTSMNRIIEIDVENQTVRVQAGATLQEVNDALEKHGLWLTNLPESKWSCTVGSSIALENDSTFGMRWGRINQALTSVQIVTGTGEVLELGHRKSHHTSSGYKLKDLIISSEGTLGVITEATLKVEPLPEYRTVDMILFPSLKTAVNYVNRLLKAGLQIEAAHCNCKRRLNFYASTYKEKYGKAPQIPDWANALLGISFSGNRDFVEFERSYAMKIAESEEFKGQILKEREIVDSWWTSKYTLLFEAFKQKWPNTQKEKKFAAADVGVPMGRLEDIYKKFVEISEKHGLEILGMNAYFENPNSIGFSLSCAVYVDYRSKKEVEAFRKFHEDMSKAAVDLEGTMSTYMSDTYLKVPYFEYEQGKSAEYMKKIKLLFDPKGIMNPGKKFARSSLKEVVQ